MQLGRELRAVLMAGLPALDKAIRKVKAEAEKGYIIGLDGRKLKSRSPHSALNLRLQGNGALIAKKWMLLTEQYLMAHGLRHGWDGDFAMLAFVHDEQQSAVRPEYTKLLCKLGVEAAIDAGHWFGFRCPVDAVAKVGRNWAECH
jgi:DNA polymerase I-like protein with 3'-5' exonuclease and polymerase domains